MPDWRPPSDHDAAERARAWLDRQHALVHAQVLQLLGEAPTEAISQALDSLSTRRVMRAAAPHHQRRPTVAPSARRNYGTADGL
jgi:uracil-DNA glycosylase